MRKHDIIYLLSIFPIVAIGFFGWCSYFGSTKIPALKPLEDVIFGESLLTLHGARFVQGMNEQQVLSAFDKMRRNGCLVNRFEFTDSKSGYSYTNPGGSMGSSIYLTFKNKKLQSVMVIGGY